MQTRDQKAMRVINARHRRRCSVKTPTRTGQMSSTACPPSCPGGDIVWTAISGDTRGLVIAPAAELGAAAPLTPAGLQVQAVLGTDGADVLFAGVGRAHRARHLALRPRRAHPR